MPNFPGILSTNLNPGAPSTNSGPQWPRGDSNAALANIATVSETAGKPTLDGAVA